MKKSKLAPITTLMELAYKAARNEKYEELAILAARNLGGDTGRNLQECLDWLEINAMETNEEGVVDEINACIDLLSWDE